MPLKIPGPNNQDFLVLIHLDICLFGGSNLIQDELAALLLQKLKAGFTKLFDLLFSQRKRKKKSNK